MTMDSLPNNDQKLLEISSYPSSVVLHNRSSCRPSSSNERCILKTVFLVKIMADCGTMQRFCSQVVQYDAVKVPAGSRPLVVRLAASCPVADEFETRPH